jgi:hypothetical protein
MALRGGDVGSGCYELKRVSSSGAGWVCCLLLMAHFRELILRLSGPVAWYTCSDCSSAYIHQRSFTSSNHWPSSAGSLGIMEVPE